MNPPQLGYTDYTQIIWVYVLMDSSIYPRITIHYAHVIKSGFESQHFREQYEYIRKNSKEPRYFQQI